MRRFLPRLPTPTTSLLGALGATSLTLAGTSAWADPGFAIHAEGSAAHTVGGAKAEQFGWGASGLVAPELKLGRVAGIELPIGAIGLSSGDGAQPAGYVPTATGSAFFVLPGLRFHPLAPAGNRGAIAPDGLWFAAGGGVARTGGLTRPGFDVRAGFDVATTRFAAGPFVGYLHVLQPDGGVRPEDGRLALFGLHATFDPGLRPRVGTTDPDRDRDGILNLADRCPDVPEDKDGFEDKDGCPDLDNDKDLIADVTDRCPNDPEDRDGFQDGDGCPEFDNDRDGIADVRDKCPNDPEDRDGFEDDDGCSDLDNDQDGFADVVDKCPNEPETVNDYADDDGCPDEQMVRVVGNRIVLDDRVHFTVNRADIRPVSWPLLGKLAGLLNGHPEYVLVHIEGHADDTGEEKYNLQLSGARAQAVRDMLVRYGVARSRLHIEAYGESRPLEAGTSVFARRQNRRVEFEILARSTIPVEAAADEAAKTTLAGPAAMALHEDAAKGGPSSPKTTTAAQGGAR